MAGPLKSEEYLGINTHLQLTSSRSPFRKMGNNALTGALARMFEVFLHHVFILLVSVLNNICKLIYGIATTGMSIGSGVSIAKNGSPTARK